MDNYLEVLELVEDTDYDTGDGYITLRLSSDAAQMVASCVEHEIPRIIEMNDAMFLSLIQTPHNEATGDRVLSFTDILVKDCNTILTALEPLVGPDPNRAID